MKRLDCRGIDVGLAILALLVCSASSCPPCRDGGVCERLVSLTDYWNETAYFVRTAHFTTPTVPEGGQLNANANQDVEVWQGTWYLYYREVFTDPSVCSGMGTYRTGVCTSVDQGAHWTGCQTIRDPSSGETECGVLDGDVFFDPNTSIFHFLAQCLGLTGGWKMCHFTSGSPTGPFLPDPAMDGVVVRGGDLFKKILGEGTTMHDEGTPEVLGNPGGTFVVSFHGIDDTNHLVRAVAATPDFRTWSALSSGPIFSKQDCDNWHVPWNDGSKCWGGGAATKLLDDGYDYVIQEASDLFGPCAENQHWFFGLMRTRNITGAEPFQQHPQNPILFSTHEQNNDGSGHTPPCALSYPKLLRDNDGSIYLFLSRGSPHTQPNPDLDKQMGHYVYRLSRSAPRAHWEFREGPGYSHTLSDVIAFGDTEATVTNVVWLPVGDDDFDLEFDGSSSVVEIPANSLFDVDGDVTLSVRVRFDGAPQGKSAFLAGRLWGYWLELYGDGTLAAWIKEKGTGSFVNATTNVAADYGTMHSYGLRVSGSHLSLMRDGVEVHSAPALGGASAGEDIGQLRAGNGTTSSGEFYGSFRGTLSSITMSVP